MKALALVVLVGCTPIYDVQYDDRASQLEESRAIVVAADKKVSTILGSQSKLFYIDIDGDEQTALLNSYDPATGATLGYEFTRGSSNIATDYHVSDALVVDCNFGEATAYDARTSAMVGMTADMGSTDKCIVDGGTVYFISGMKILKWTPGLNPTPVIDISTMTGASDIDTIGVTGDLVVFAEGGRLWKGSVSTGQVTRIQSADQTSSADSFDMRGVIIEGAKGAQYIKLADSSTFYVKDAISDGGYDLNFKHSDAQDLADGSALEIADPYIVYRGSDGIFVLDLNTTKVSDILLDRGDDDFSQEPRYSDPVVAGGMVFTQDISEATGATHPVYGVKLATRFAN